MENKILDNRNLKAYFEKQYAKELTDTEVIEYKDRLIKFFSLLIEIDQRNKRKKVEVVING